MRFPGIIPAVTTPFTADDQVDVAALKANCEALVEAGVHGFVATGTMGEAGSLSAAERKLVLETVVEAVDGAVPVIAGISAGGMPVRVKCLHALAGHALAAGPGVNPIGDLALELAAWSPLVCQCADYSDADYAEPDPSTA